LNSRVQWLIAQFTRRLWFRAAIYGVVAIATALFAALTSRFFPAEMANVIGAEAVGDILKILASSMLAVATFSLGTMVAAFSAAADIATPRASKLLIQDPTSQNALATFIGAFIFSLIGIVVLSTGYYGPGVRVVLFIVTIIVIVIIIVTFFRWIDYLSNLGRLGAVLEKVERAASRAMQSRVLSPCLGGRPLLELPDRSIALVSRDMGYVQYLDVAALDAIAEQANGVIYVACLPGAFADGHLPVARASWSPTDEQRENILQAFVIGSERSFDQDPRFGLIALSEIASRALSPGINDPGTAIDVIGRLIKVLALWTDSREEENDVAYPNVFIPAIAVLDMFDDAFKAIARDRAGTLEVGIRLQKALLSLAKRNNKSFGESARIHAALALERTDAAALLDDDRLILRNLANELLPALGRVPLASSVEGPAGNG
jgi:uncharacterized membrane protein